VVLFLTGAVGERGARRPVGLSAPAELVRARARWLCARLEGAHALLIRQRPQAQDALRTG
jgi:hypothetical protein